VICALIETTVERLPAAFAAMNCVKPAVLPVCP